jgi:hypothetical protein
MQYACPFSWSLPALHVSWTMTCPLRYTLHNGTLLYGYVLTPLNIVL